MQLVSYRIGDDASFGIWKVDGIVDLKGKVAGGGATLRSVLDNLDGVAGHQDDRFDHAHDAVELLPPVTHKSHIAGTGRDTQAYPILFPRYSASLVGSGEDLVRPKASSDSYFEGELAFVIGKKGRDIAVANAAPHVVAYACFNDGSIRRHTTQFMPGKSLWCSGSFGPWLVTSNEVGDICGAVSDNAPRRRGDAGDTRRPAVRGARADRPYIDGLAARNPALSSRLGPRAPGVSSVNRCE